MVFDFSGKKILVTGATRGIGRALTKSLVDAGAIVYGLGSNQELLDSLVKECPSVHPIKGDLAEWDAIRQELEKLPPMNSLVNNAGVTLPCISSLEASKDMITKTFDVNVMAAINVTQVIGKKMVETGQGGSIVNVSSIAGINPLRESMAYCMSKAALDMMTKQFALELGPYKIRVNSVNPTVVLTGMGIDFVRDPLKTCRLKDHTPLGRFAEIRESVDPVMYLLSDYSSMVTGTINPIEGGLLSNISVWKIRESVDPVLYLLSDYSSMVTGTINPIKGGLLSNILVWEIRESVDPIMSYSVTTRARWRGQLIL